MDGLFGSQQKIKWLLVEKALIEKCLAIRPWAAVSDGDKAMNCLVRDTYI